MTTKSLPYVVATKKSKARTTGCCIFIILSIVSADALVVAINVNAIYETITQILYMAAVGVLLVYHYTCVNGRITISTNTILFILTICSLIVSYVIVNDSITSYAFKALLIIGGYYFSKTFSIDDFYNTFRKIMFVLMISSLVLYIIKVIGFDLSFLPSIFSNNGLKYNTIFIANIFDTYNGLMRAQSIFWEAGVYAAYLNIILCFELFYKQNIDFKYIALIMLSLITTLSTTGLIAAPIIVLAYLFSKSKKSRKDKLFIVITSILCFGIVFLESNSINQIFDKIINGSESFNNRWSSIYGNYMMIKEAPLFGLGPVKSNLQLKQYIMSQGGRRSFSNLNTILANYSVFGFVPFLYYVYSLFGFAFSCNNKIVTKIICLFGLVFLLSSTGYQYSPFFTLVFMYRFNYINNSTTSLERG